MLRFLCIRCYALAPRRPHEPRTALGHEKGRATCPGVDEKANKGIDEKVFVEVSGGQVEVSERVLIGDSHVHQ